jgi:hypothetical protein
MYGKARAVIQKADRWGEQAPFSRFWNNEKVTEKALTGCMEDHCREQCAGLEEAGLIEDTSEMNLERHRKRIKDTAGLGTVVGAIDLMLWARKGEPEGKAGKGKRPARKPLEEKESYRRAERAVIGRERLSKVPKVTVVQDRKGDIYESYPLLKEHDVNWVIRAGHDRKAKREGEAEGPANTLRERKRRAVTGLRRPGAGKRSGA